MLGAVEARRGDVVIKRWPSRATAALLARLALAPSRAHPREELVELLWPGVLQDVGRNRLRQALSTLRSLVEVDGAELFEADRHFIRLRPGVLRCDAVDFEQRVCEGQWAAARQAWGGELMPGHYEDWVLEARAHLATLHDRLSAQPAPPPQAMATLSALPSSWTRVFGIEHSATRLRALVGHERLVTVVGPGGCGKTRLALEVCRSLRDAPAWAPGHVSSVAPARVIFVPLVDCRDAAQAEAALGLALRLSGRDGLPQIQDRLADAPTLVLLDNFEQLVESAAGLVMRLLEAAPELRLLITSRLRLGLPGEQVFALHGLPVPDERAVPDRAEAMLNPAVALFVDRARAVQPDWHPAASELADLCALVRQLAGMPLALELAASRIGSFNPSQMVALLRGDSARGSRLDWLARPGPRAGHDARHASMTEVIDWSWRLLGPPAQAALRALAACAGDAGLPMLAAMLHEPESAMALRLDELAAHSMLRRTGDAPHARWALLEPVGEVVRARSGPDEARRLQLSQCGWLLRWALALPRSAAGSRIEAELHHVRAMLAAEALPERHRLELMLALRSHWESSGMPLSLQQPLEQVVERLAQGPDPDAAALVADAHELLSCLRFESGFAEQARRHAAAALAAAGPDAPRRARALVRQAWLDLASGTPEALAPRAVDLQASLDEALALARSAGDRDAEARSLHQMAVLASYVRRDWAGAERLLEQSQALWLALGDRRMAFARLRNRGQCWLRLGRVDDARSCFETCARVAREEGNVVEHIDSLVSLSSLLGEQRRWAEALAADRECVQLCWEHWHRHGLAYALWNPPLALARLRRPADAVRLMAFAVTYWSSIVGTLADSDRRTALRVRRLCRAQIGAAEEARLWTDGATMTIAQAVALAVGSGPAA